MLFNSLHFLIFFPVVTLLYFLLPYRWRVPMLLAASCYFYMALIPVYILILFFVIVVDYFAGMLIENAEGHNRRLFLLASLTANIGVLGFFKYFNFLNTNISEVSQLWGGQPFFSNLNIILPIGLSFHTFQSISYTVEVYRGNHKAERNLSVFALYVLFYPQLVAGPIERPQNLLHQFYEKHDFDYRRVTDGLKLMAWGMFKKVVIADRLGVAVNMVYENPTDYSGLPLIIATYFFAIQIYCDFSGYSDIAIGAAQVMGFRLMDNFNRPYHSKSISEFWKRWHISLSTWFRDYLYLPLGGNRVGKRRWHFNLFFVFIVSGLWHGAAWTFVIWGALHGSYLLVALWTRGSRDKIIRYFNLQQFPTLRKAVAVFVTFNLVSFAWIFFRAQSVQEAFYIVTHLFTWSSTVTGKTALVPVSLFILDRTELLIAFAAVAFMEFVHLIQRHRKMRHFLSKKPFWMRWTVYYVLIMTILLFGKFATKSQFIYFQF
jgi:D-alanyl-lipoteichoic acid acyltransferase DltB (MBOAT superfamily)